MNSIEAAKSVVFERFKNYEKMVRDLAENVEHDPLAVIQVCENAGKSLDELDFDAERIKSRIEARAKLDELPGLASQRDAAQRAKEAEAEEFAAELATLQRDHDRAVAVASARSKAKGALIDERLAKLNALIEEAQTAEGLLRETADEKSIEAFEAAKLDLAQATERFDAKGSEIRRRIARLESVLATLIVPPVRDENLRPIAVGEPAASRIRRDEQKSREAVLTQKSNIEREIPSLQRELANLENAVVSAQKAFDDAEKNLFEV